MSDINPSNTAVQQLRLQNEHFKQLLLLAKKRSSNKAACISKLDDETRFTQQTLLFLDYEKKQSEKLHNDIISMETFTLPSTESENLQKDVLLEKLNTLDAENVDLRHKLLDVIEKLSRDLSELTKINQEQEEIKNFIYESNLMGILQIPGEKLDSPKFISLEEGKGKIKEFVLTKVKPRSGRSVRSLEYYKRSEDSSGDFRSLPVSDDECLAVELPSCSGDSVNLQGDGNSVLSQIKNVLGLENETYWNVHDHDKETRLSLIKRLGYKNK